MFVCVFADAISRFLIAGAFFNVIRKCIFRSKNRFRRFEHWLFLYQTGNSPNKTVRSERKKKAERATDLNVRFCHSERVKENLIYVDEGDVFYANNDDKRERGLKL